MAGELGRERRQDRERGRGVQQPDTDRERDRKADPEAGPVIRADDRQQPGAESLERAEEAPESVGREVGAVEEREGEGLTMKTQAITFW